MSGIVIGRRNSNCDSSIEEKQQIELIKNISLISNKSDSLKTTLNLEKPLKKTEIKDEKPIYNTNTDSVSFISADSLPDINYKKNITIDFNKFLKRISISNKEGRLAEKLPSGYEGIDELEKITAKKISLILSDDNRKKLCLMSESGKSQTYFPEAWGNFLMCLSIHSDQELVDNKESINNLTKKLYTLFDKKNKFSTSYYDKHEEFNKKLDRHLKNYFKTSNKSIHSIVMENFNKNVFSDEFKKHIAHLYNKNNDMHDVFRPSIDGYLRGHQVLIDEFGSVTLSSDLTVLLRRSFAFRDILKYGNENKSNLTDNESVKDNEKDDKKKHYDNIPDSSNGQFGNSNGIFVNGNNNTVFNAPINIHNTYIYAPFSFERPASAFTDSTSKKFFTVSSHFQKERNAETITSNSDKSASQPSAVEIKNAAIPTEPVALGWKQTISEEPVPLGWKQTISEEPVPLGWKQAISEEPVPLGWKQAISENPVSLGWKTAISDEPVPLDWKAANTDDAIPLGWKHMASTELLVKSPEQIFSVKKKSVLPANLRVRKSQQHNKKHIKAQLVSLKHEDNNHKKIIIDATNFTDTEIDEYIRNLPEENKSGMAYLLPYASISDKDNVLSKTSHSMADMPQPAQAINTNSIKKSVSLSEYIEESQNLAARLSMNTAS